MIVTSISGGLGNQLFQYGIAKRISKENNNDKIFLDCSWFRKSHSTLTKRRLELDKFDLFSTASQIKHQSTSRALRLGLELKHLLGLKKYKKYTEEKSFVFDENLIKNNYKNIFLNGYWQSYKYYDSIKDDLCNNIRIKDKLLSDNDKKYIHEAQSTNSVFLHVRKGDYKNTVLDNLNPEYYYNAIQYIKNTTQNPINLFIFSDDHDWVKKNFKINCNHFYVDHNNEERCANDLTIMANCKHSIIANSSYSWWGAYIGYDKKILEKRIVVAPSRWWNGIHHSRIDIYPEHWIKLE